MMVLPILIGFMAAVYHFGWIMGTKQRLRMVERHGPWHVARSRLPRSHEDAPWLTDAQIDDDYMLGRPVSIRREEADAIEKEVPGDGDDDASAREPVTSVTMDELAEWVGAYSDWAGPIAYDVLNFEGEYPYDHGVVLKLWVTIPSVVGLWDLLDLEMVGLYGREGLEWRRKEDHVPEQLLMAARDEMFSNLKDALGAIPEPGRELAGVFDWFCVEAWVDLDGND